jgi:hypothetical protein
LVKKAMPTRTATATRNQQLNLATAQLAGGTLRIYSGTQPGSPDTPAPGTALVTHALSRPAFALAILGSSAARVISPGIVAQSGEATWFRLSTPADTPIYDGGIPAELQLDQPYLTRGAELIVDSLTLTLPA